NHLDREVRDALGYYFPKGQSDTRLSSTCLDITRFLKALLMYRASYATGNRTIRIQQEKKGKEKKGKEKINKNEPMTFQRVAHREWRFSWQLKTRQRKDM